MSYNSKPIVLQVSSDPANGAEIVNPKSQRFRAKFGAGGIHLDRNKEHTMTLISFDGWATSPNISANRANNILSYSADGTTPAPGTFNVVFPDGSYGPDDLAAYLLEFTTNVGHSATFADPVFSITPSLTTGTIYVTFIKAGYQWLTSSASNAGFCQVLGLNPAIDIPAAPSTAGQVVGGPNVADFSQNLNIYVLNSNIAKDTYYNGQKSTVLAVMPLSLATANGPLTYRPTNPVPVGVVTDFEGAEFWLEDAVGGGINLNNEQYQATIRIDSFPRS